MDQPKSDKIYFKAFQKVYISVKNPGNFVSISACERARNVWEARSCLDRQMNIEDTRIGEMASATTEGSCHGNDWPEMDRSALLK